MQNRLFGKLVMGLLVELITRENIIKTITSCSSEQQSMQFTTSFQALNEIAKEVPPTLRA